jgi:hypothetical protein
MEENKNIIPQETPSPIPEPMPKPTSESPFPRIFLIVASLGLGITIFVVYGLVATAQQIVPMLKKLEVAYSNEGIIYALILSLLILPVVSLIYGVYVKRRQVESFSITRNQKIIGILLLFATICINSAIAGRVVLQMMDPIYNVMTNVGEISPPVAISPSISTPGTFPIPVVLAQQNLAEIAKTDISQIEVVFTEKTEWNDSSLGCPKKGMMYAQVITPGYKVLLKYKQSTYEYHTDMNQNVVSCRSYGASTEGK